MARSATAITRCCQCAANAAVTKDPMGARKLDKARATGRIDGLQAMAMALITNRQRLNYGKTLQSDGYQ